MTENNAAMNTDWIDPDDAPDLSLPEWRTKIEASPVKMGRPNLQNPKQSTTLRLDADIIQHFRAGGPGWQSRINAALKQWLKDHQS